MYIRRITTSLLTGMLLSALCGVLQASSQTVPESLAASRIHEVIVFTDRAQVTRRADQTLQKGVQRLVFQDLPAALLPESLRASGQGVKILGININTKSLAESRAAERQRLVEEIGTLTSRLKELTDNQITLEESLIDLENLSAGLATNPALLQKKASQADTAENAEVAPNGTQKSALPAALLDELRERRKTIREELRKLTPQEAALTQQLTQRQTELKTLGDLAEAEGYEVTVDVGVEKQGRVILDLSYIINGASWRPVYDARYLKEKSQLEISYGAMVKQRTGEDWKDVNLVLSTARPHLGGRPRELQPFYLRSALDTQRAVGPEPNRTVPEIDTTARGDGSALQSLSIQPTSTESDAGGGLIGIGSETPGLTETPEASFSTALQTEGVEATYAVQHPCTVLNGGAEEKAAIVDLTFDVIPEHQCIPSQAPFAYLQAVTKNTSDYVLIGGRTNVFFGSDYLSPTTIDTTLPGDDLEIYLGPDPRVEVTRELVSRTLDNSGFIAQAGEVSCEYQIEIINRSEDDLRINVHDRIPVTTESEIHVRDFRSTPNAIRDENTGMLTWAINLNANSTQTIKFSYSVRFPKGEIPPGL